MDDERPRGNDSIRIPSTENVQAVMADLGFEVSSEEAELFRGRLATILPLLARSYSLRVPEERLAVGAATRDPGYRPSEDEDPARIFIRKCHVQGPNQGALTGKTIGLKDTIPVAGVPMSMGTRLLENFVPDYDATVVLRLLEAGATIVGKLNTDQFSVAGANAGGLSDFGRPLNPHHPDRATGGTSSGAGAAVAARAVDIALGTDAGGSVRIPAAWCGVVGHKPSRGLVPMTGCAGHADPTLGVIGPMARTVDEVAACLGAIAGDDGIDPRQGRIPSQIDVLKGLDRGLKGLRIGVVEEGMSGVDDGVLEACLSAIDTMAESGADIRRISIPEHNDAYLPGLALLFEGSRMIWETFLAGAFSETIYPRSLVEAIGRIRYGQPELIAPNLMLRYTAAEFTRRWFHGGVYAKANAVRHFYRDAYDRALAEVDVLFMPTVPVVATSVGHPGSWIELLDTTLFGGSGGINLELIARNTFPFNTTGHPAISIPCGKADGMPVGAQLVGPYLMDAVVLRAAKGFQDAVRWEEMIALPDTPNPEHDG